MIRCWVAIGVWLCCLGASAHESSDSFMRLDVTGAVVDGEWDIALRDLEYALGIDDDGDGAITWGELRTRHDAIANYALPRIALSVGERACNAQVTEHLVNRHRGRAYAVLRFRARCPQRIEQLTVRYALLFDLDPSHRGLLRVRAGDATQIGVFSPDEPRRVYQVSAPGSWHQGLQFAYQGAWHIWSGYDHLLFLLCLLLPAALRRHAGVWQPEERLRVAAWSVFKIVTSFTLAHTVTLSLAALGFVQWPSVVVEAGIAASIVVAACNNLYPLITARLWIVALAFGLLHGLGFASGLQGLLTGGAPLLTALVGFNLGVEAGQCVVIGVLLPLAFAARRTLFYRRVVLQAGSVVIAGIGLLWFGQRIGGG